MLFRRGATPEHLAKKTIDEEAAPSAQAEKHTINPKASFNTQKSIFHWEDLCYDVHIKTEERRILDNVDGWVKPGTLTALMVTISKSFGSE